MGDSLPTSTSRIKRDLVDNSLRGTKTGTSHLPMIYIDALSRFSFSCQNSESCTDAFFIWLNPLIEMGE